METWILDCKDHNEQTTGLECIDPYSHMYCEIPQSHFESSKIILLLFTWLHLGSILKQAGMNTTSVTVAEMKMFECQDQLIAHLLSQ